MMKYIFIVGIIISIIVMSGCISEEVPSEAKEQVKTEKAPPEIIAEANISKRCSKIPLDAISKISGFSDIRVKDSYRFLGASGSLSCSVVFNETGSSFLDIYISYRRYSSDDFESRFNDIKNHMLIVKGNRVVDIIGLGQRAFFVEYKHGQGQDFINTYLFVLDNETLLELESTYLLNNPKSWLTDHQLKEIASEILAIDFSINSRCSKIPRDTISKIIGLSDIEVKDSDRFFGSSERVSCLIFSNETEGVDLTVSVFFRNSSQLESQFNSAKKDAFQGCRIFEITGLGQKAFLDEYCYDKGGLNYSYLSIYVLDNEMLLVLNYRKDFDNSKYLLIDDQLKEIASEIFAIDFPSENQKFFSNL